MNLILPRDRDDAFGMTAMHEHSKPSKIERAGAPGPAQHVAGDNVLPEHANRFSAAAADCCIARPAYRVVFRSSGADAHPAELYLCGHHYRRSTTSLLERQATVYDESNRLLASFA